MAHDLTEIKLPGKMEQKLLEILKANEFPCSILTSEMIIPIRNKEDLGFVLMGLRLALGLSAARTS